MTDQLTALAPQMPIPFGGDRVTYVSDELAAAFQPGDRLVVMQSSGTLLHITADVSGRVDEAVGRAREAFAALASVTDAQLTDFFDLFAAHLEDDQAFGPIRRANDEDLAQALSRGRSTTRLELSSRMRADMVSGLRSWRDQPAGRDHLEAVVEHDGWSVEQRRAPLGVIGFVFEGRPNVFADATGVLRTGNTVVFRIGSDALRTARAIVESALLPALRQSGLPEGAVVLLDTPARSGGWALFADQRLSLAVARGSGAAVDQLGEVARQSGVPVSLHGTGGAWLVVAPDADPDRFGAAVFHSLDRKVCNTLNVCCVPRAIAGEFLPVFLDALDRAGLRRDAPVRLHVAAGAEHPALESWFAETVAVTRAEGVFDEPKASRLDVDQLSTEWEWENSPEVSLVLVDDVAHAVALFNEFSPRFGISLISGNVAEHDRLWSSVDAPFVGDGFTRWVDGQFALDKPELGLSNWQHGRLFARSGILSGDSAYTVRLRVRQTDPDLHR